MFLYNAHAFCRVKSRSRIFKFKIYSLQMIRPSLHPCFHGIPMPMCLLCTLLRIQHACALEYDKPWQIQHISIFSICSCLAVRLIMLHTSIFYEILETYMVFFTDSKYVNFKRNRFFSIFFWFIFCHHSLTQKTHC